MNQSGNTNNSNFLNDCLTMALDPDTLNLSLSALRQNPNFLPFGLSMMQRYPVLTANYVQIQANMIRGANQSTNLAQEKEVLAQRNKELAQRNKELAQEKEVLAQRNKELAQQNKELAQQNEKLQKKNKALENTVTDCLNSFFVENRQLNEKFGQQLIELQQKNEKLTQQLSESQNTALIFETESKALRSKLYKSEDCNKTLLKENDDLRKQINELQKRTADSERKNTIGIKSSLASKSLSLLEKMNRVKDESNQNPKENPTGKPRSHSVNQKRFDDARIFE